MGLHALALKPKNLQQIKWAGDLHIPLDILELIYNQFPTAKVSVNLDIWGVQLAQPCALLTHPVASQLTHCTLVSKHPDQFYPAFKSDLIQMIQANTHLANLILDLRLYLNYEYPEYTPYIRSGDFAKLEHFSLQTLGKTFFTVRELTL
jgi:hypothetical protein